VADYGFVRISTGSQDAQTQERDILKVAPGAAIIRPDGKAASASKGEQLDALDAVIVKLRKGDRVIVTDSSRLDRRDNLTSQVETMLAIRKTGAAIVSLAPGEETFASGDDLISWITTLVKQNANAEKSRTVKTQTRRGMTLVQQNGAHHGTLPLFWATRGERYGKQAHCTNPEAVKDIYTRVADGESLQSVSNRYDFYPQSLRNLIRFEANHTGVINCVWSGLEWVHKVTPVVESALWWRANKVLDANVTKDRANRGGRPVAQPANWLSGVLDCPECGGKLYVHNGRTPAVDHRTGKPRTQKPRSPMLRCGGLAKVRRPCGRYRAVDARLVMAELDRMFRDDATEVMAFQRVAGNGHELDEMKADLARLQARLSVTEDDDALDKLVADRKALRARIAGFVVIPDRFDYAPIGQTIADMWAESDESKRRIVKAVAGSIGLDISPVWGMDGNNLWLGVLPSERVSDGIVDLGEGICFRPDTAA
jgi:DNA invertase Pin-like site-specific DNA recombinase